MQWALGHRARGIYDFTEVTVDATSSEAAIEQLRATLPDTELILYVRRESEPYAASE